MSEDKVFVTKEITNQDIYNMLVKHGDSLTSIEEQTKKTNGRVTALEDIAKTTCARVKTLEHKSIVMFIIRYKYVLLMCIAIGMLIAGWNIERIKDFVK